MKHISITVNGDQHELLVEANWTLLETLRDHLRLTGTKEGCSNGNCGACTVMVNGRTANSCLVLAAEMDGNEITTIEGIASQGKLNPVQEAFIKDGALQCGFCTPGFIISATALLQRNPDPSEEEIRTRLAGNLCRCTGYDKIVMAVEDAAAMLRT
ncbi:MAG TPA: (2Fe-2S)-binding protein [Dehalococcoidia bacterium]|jgi:carbon-monoxide dehydrogenase small subunit|nr:ferredoxin [Chloroflexota bacterium]MDP5876246.1 (2Fe-2S)-binding protein [Dehalococcoidia bacterium]MDP6272643.1 (2Fe-2S)-binding protein [Dehalococcoidia bacterium]MDP7161419.1 (2Fe-2S)-binding protein [Dehalococcoidia bacterium]MDP7212654.1 (2Fe-2S)-binding protein [Dehalococcoidia bacterium]|tara:strand:+ start:1352 stop:1819 length:468 start_codon:yes stop_codon:yes gene_type:complete